MAVTDSRNALLTRIVSIAAAAVVVSATAVALVAAAAAGPHPSTESNPCSDSLLIGAKAPDGAVAPRPAADPRRTGR